MSSWATVIVMTGDWLFLPDIVDSTRVTNSQAPLPEHSAVNIYYIADKDNTARIFRTTDSLSAAEGQPLLAEESWDDLGSAGASRSLREWFVKGTIGDKLEVQMVN